ERYAITVSDPLSASQQAWAYLYRSATLTRSNASYITWTYGIQTASALSYTAAFSPTRFVGLSDLFLNGGTGDVLDRQKIRLATFLGTLNEESIVTLLGAATITLPIAGPVRAVTNDGDLRAAFYGSRLDFDITFDFSGLPLTPSSVRTSFDWISPTLSGLTTYYDSNTPGGVAIDGVPDVVPTTPRINWFQINGGAAGPGGLVMTIPRVDPHGGTATNYYKDDGADDANDTGDRRSYGDSGLRINGPFASPAAISFTLSAYILPLGSNSNVGAAYFARANNPLQASAAQQCNTPSGMCSGVPIPPAHVVITGTTAALVDYPQTYVANVDPVTASLPLTYTWQATDQSPLTIAGGLSTSATFTWTSTGPKMISVTVSNDGGAANADPLTIWVRSDAFTPPAHVGITGTTATRVDYAQTYVADVDPVTASVPLTYMWQATDYSPLTIVSGLSSSATFTWTSTGFKHISVTVYNEGGVVSADPFLVEVRTLTFLPLVLKGAP
ncbi:MAG TPA: hypothetical protein VLG46_10265, partial [Anaerolineae bacterium]|nr:hypothetical protein [Anaerolineae bacterium]